MQPELCILLFRSEWNAKPVNNVFVPADGQWCWCCVMLRANCFNQTLASDATDTYINLTRPPEKTQTSIPQRCYIYLGDDGRWGQEALHSMDGRMDG